MDLPDAYTELVAAEMALRAAIRIPLRNEWQSTFTPEDIQKLETKRAEEGRRRDGVTVSQDLLDYTEVYHSRRSSSGAGRSSSQSWMITPGPWSI